MILLLSLIAFDFAKDPIKRYLLHASDAVQTQIMADNIKNNNTFSDLAWKMDNTVTSEERNRRMRTGPAVTTENIIGAGDAMIVQQTKSLAAGSAASPLSEAVENIRRNYR